jgi:hypothetical protein
MLSAISASHFSYRQTTHDAQFEDLAILQVCLSFDSLQRGGRHRLAPSQVPPGPPLLARGSGDPLNRRGAIRALTRAYGPLASKKSNAIYGWRPQFDMHVQIDYIANMSTKTATLGVRMPKATCDLIRQLSARKGRTPSDLLAQYAEEITRMHRFCHIEFREAGLGRMAYVEGTRSAVWLVCDLVRQNHGNVRKTARVHQWPETNVRSAVNYAKAYPEEVEPLIARARGMEETTLRELNAG